MECDRCPSAGTNTSIMLLGFLVAVIVLGIMIVHHMDKGGRRSLSSMHKMIVFNYFQLSFMIASMDVPWPKPLKILFDVEGTMSTVGEHLLNPSCVLHSLSSADIVYLKQIVYMLVLPAFILLSKALWKAISCYQGRSFRYRGENGLSPSHKDGSVATTVFLMYFIDCNE